MTQEEKAKAYDEALKIAKRIISKNCSEVEKLCLKSIFPELAESEDEKIRKALIEVFKKKLEKGFEWVEYGIPNRSVLAWLEKQKEQKPVEKQDYSGLNDLERVIHRGFLAAGVENVPAGIIKETAQECLTNIKPAWSEEDEEVMEDLYNFVISDFIQDHIHETRWKPWKTTLERNRQNRLKSLRPVSKESLQPHWKPSEEQMNALYNVINPCDHVDKKALESLYEQLKKLI